MCSTSNNHLRNTLASQCLAANEPLPLETSDGVAYSSDQQEHGSSKQARAVTRDQTQPLYHAHYEVDGGAHVICGKAAYELIELFGGRTYAKEERYFDEQEDEGACSVVMLSALLFIAADYWTQKRAGRNVQTYRAEHDDHWPEEVEDICYPQCEAKDYAEYANPLAVDAF